MLFIYLPGTIVVIDAVILLNTLLLADPVQVSQKLL